MMTDELLAACERLKSNDGDYWWSVDRLPHAAKDVRAVSSALPALVARVRELEKFKAYVHKRLDDAGIDTHPDGPHSKEGCRIGDRLNIALAADAKLAAIEAVCKDYCNTAGIPIALLAREILAILEGK